mgnify:CR=1 FL=1
MAFEENDKTELKREVAESLKKEVIAFANTSGGIIYISYFKNYCTGRNGQALLSFGKRNAP